MMKSSLLQSALSFLIIVWWWSQLSWFTRGSGNLTWLLLMWQTLAVLLTLESLEFLTVSRMWFLSWADVFWQLFLDCDWVISQGRQIVHINRIARHEEFISNEIAQKCSLLTEDPNNRLTPTNRSSWVAIHTHPPDLVRLLYTGSSKVAIHQILCTCYALDLVVRLLHPHPPDLVHLLCL